jgi:hypothetical protein
MAIKAACRAAASAILFICIATCLATEAKAQATRTFGCEGGRAVTITVTGPSSISARPIDGATMSLRSRGPNDFRFINGDYLIAISPDQRSLKAEIPDWGSATCRVQQQAARPNQPGLGNADPCGPGFQQNPRTKRCDPRPGMAQAAPPPDRPVGPKRADDPCPANFQQVPETDRCDPMPGAPAPRTATAGPDDFPMVGRSLGGIMRSGPSQSSARVASLGEGVEITIMGRGPMWDGYNWFKVDYQGRTGFQWGGIMCSQNPIAGIHQQCAP